MWNKQATKINFNLYKDEWKRVESMKPQPDNYNKLIEIDHKEFISKIHKQEPLFVKSTIESIYNGDLYLLKNSISKENVNYIIDTIHKYNISSPSTFHKLHEGVPNFHRWIDKSVGERNYCIKHVKHSTYLFPWNEDIGEVGKIIFESSRPLKLLAGLELDTFSTNTPNNNQIERIQIARYPPTGWIEPHADPTPIIRLIISGYLSKRGVDYDEGGFYMIDKKNGKLDLENHIDVGDIGFFCASLRHGLERIDPSIEPDINKTDGRWWWGLNMHNSDIMKPEMRATGMPYNINS